MKVTVIISYYKNLKNLKLILKGLNRQNASNFEVIISEDDANKNTDIFVAEEAKKYNFPILHLNQKVDDGFRKNSMLNKSINASSGDTLVFVDGDCIPNKHFVKEYQKNTEDGYILKGRRVMLGEKVSSKILEEGSLDYLSPISLLFSDSKKVKEAFYTAPFSLSLTMKNKGLLGCNWGIKKKHLLAINGFDEDYIHAAVGEDTDVEWRLLALGLKSKSMKNKSIVFHLHHERSYSDKGVAINMELLKKKQKDNHFRCTNGIDSLRE